MASTTNLLKKNITQLLTVALLAICPPSEAMLVEASGSVVYMSGDVVGDECKKLSEILNTQTIDLVVLGDSNGGDANAGFCVGETIRKNKISTVINGVCVSSCSRMWLGGVSRKLEGNASAVGLHGNYSNGRLIDKSTTRLREWIPRFAPNVDIELMNRWTALFYSKHMMYFYNNRSTLCMNGRSECENFKDRNVFNAGLSTQ